MSRILPQPKLDVARKRNCGIMAVDAGQTANAPPNRNPSGVGPIREEPGKTPDLKCNAIPEQPATAQHPPAPRALIPRAVSRLTRRPTSRNDLMDTRLEAGLSSYANAAIQRAEASLTDDAHRAISNADSLHSLLDELENRLFGPSPRGVALGSQEIATSAGPPLATAVRNVRQRLDSAGERLSSIIGRL